METSNQKLETANQNNEKLSLNNDELIEESKKTKTELVQAQDTIKTLTKEVSETKSTSIDNKKYEEMKTKIEE